MAQGGMRLGLIGLVNEEWKQDVAGTAQALVQMGYAGVESPAWVLEQDTEARHLLLTNAGLPPICVGTAVHGLMTDLDGVLANAAALQVDRVSCWWSACASAEEVDRDAGVLNEAAHRLQNEGLTLCYHNHAHEFRNEIDGERAWDRLVRQLDPGVKFELDVCWVALGGAEPAALLRQFAGRVPAIHVKDHAGFAREAGKEVWQSPQFTTCGTGVVDLAAALEAADETGVEWAVVEQDHLRNLSGVETALASALNLKELAPDVWAR